jgi:RNA polymerase sigma factor (sigma-70 family)
MSPEALSVSHPAAHPPADDPSGSEVARDVPLDVGDLFRAHGRTVMRWAARLGGPGIDAEDIAQEVFLVARRRLRSFAGPGKVSTWLFRATERIALAARRKRRWRRWLAGHSDAAASSMGAPRPTPAEAFERGREIGEVYRVLDRLPERQRRVLILFELDGLSTEEIAQLVGARMGTVRVWLFRARARFLEEHQRLFPPDVDASGGGGDP